MLIYYSEFLTSAKILLDYGVAEEKPSDAQPDSFGKEVAGARRRSLTGSAVKGVSDSTSAFGDALCSSPIEAEFCHSALFTVSIRRHIVGWYSFFEGVASQ